MFVFHVGICMDYYITATLKTFCRTKYTKAFSLLIRLILFIIKNAQRYFVRFEVFKVFEVFHLINSS